MISKASSQKGNSYKIIYTILVITLLVALGLILWTNFLQSKQDTPKENDKTYQHEERSKNGNTLYTIEGKITEKNTSCGKEVLQNDGSIKSEKWICDGGNGIVVNKLFISTGGGALTPNPPAYITDIKSIHAGDEVEVRYVHDENGHPTTTCESCYVKKEGSPEKERQNKQNR